jgi:hypothetical protein
VPEPVLPVLRPQVPLGPCSECTGWTDPFFHLLPSFHLLPFPWPRHCNSDTRPSDLVAVRKVADEFLSLLEEAHLVRMERTCPSFAEVRATFGPADAPGKADGADQPKTETTA